MSTFYKAGRIILEDKILHEAYLEVKADRAFGKVYDTVSDSVDIVDYSSYTIAPGLVDTHIHGYAGYDVMDVDFDGLNRISEGLLSCGITSFLPTTLTDSTDNLNAACELIGNRYEDVKGLKLEEFSLKGLFLRKSIKGHKIQNI